MRVKQIRTQNGAKVWIVDQDCKKIEVERQGPMVRVKIGNEKFFMTASEWGFVCGATL